MRFTDIDINFDVRYEGHQNCLKILSINILSVFSDHHLWRQNWHQYLWTSLCQFIFFVNLLHSLGVWIFDIWHFFDNLTSFWQLDIFLTFWYITWTISAHHWLGVKVGSRGTCDSVCPILLYPLPKWPICPVPYTPVPHTPCTLLPHVAHTSCTHCPCILYPIPLYPIAHTPCTLLPHCLCGWYPLYPIPCTLMPHTPVPHTPVPYCPMWPTPLCPIPPVPIAHTTCTPITHVAYTPCTPYPFYAIAHVPITPVPHWAIGYMGNEGNGV